MNDYKGLNNRVFLVNLYSGKIDLNLESNYDFIILVDKESDSDFIRKQGLNLVATGEFAYHLYGIHAEKCEKEFLNQIETLSINHPYGAVYRHETLQSICEHFNKEKNLRTLVPFKIIVIYDCEDLLNEFLMSSQS